MIVTGYGMAFHSWMEENIKAGHALDGFTPFAPGPVALCEGFTFQPGTAARIETLLKEK